MGFWMEAMSVIMVLAVILRWGVGLFVLPLQQGLPLEEETRHVLFAMRKVQQEALFGYVNTSKQKLRLMMSEDGFGYQKSGRWVGVWHAFPNTITCNSMNIRYVEVAFRGDGRPITDMRYDLVQKKNKACKQIIIAAQTGRIRVEEK